MLDLHKIVLQIDKIIINTPSSRIGLISQNSDIISGFRTFSRTDVGKIKRYYTEKDRIEFFIYYIETIIFIHNYETNECYLYKGTEAQLLEQMLYLKLHHA